MAQVVKGSKQMEGAGVRICRTVGTAALRNLVRAWLPAEPRSVVKWLRTDRDTSCTSAIGSALLLLLVFSCKSQLSLHMGAE